MNNLMKITTSFFIILLLLSCNRKGEYWDNNNDIQKADISEESEYFQELDDFEIINITKSEFDDKGSYAFNFQLKNNTTYKFSNAYLSAKIYYEFPDGYECESVFQHGPSLSDIDIDPLSAENWSSKESISYKILSPDNRTSAGCNTTFERTPNKVELELSLKAFSVDKEINDEVIKVIDLLPIWKEKQRKLGLR